ncbi:MAG TPA: phosphatidate cytidylyltransferase [Spirochaetia bacterium]|nr:phosphatidate cytidylyltransferase [Spirochaetia bacterium]
MNWKSFLVRILLVAVAFPLFAVLIFALPHLYHLAFNVLVVAATVAGAFEMASLFRTRGIPTSTLLAPILSAAFPIGAYLEVCGLFSPAWMGMWLPLAVGTVLVRAVFFHGDRKLSTVLAFTSSSVFTFFYPGFFLAWIVRLSGLGEPSMAILYFLCLVFGNDMLAYFAGSLWGSSTRLNLSISPHKSVLGFAAGIAGSLIIVGIFQVAVPAYPRFGPWLKIVLGVCTGITVIVGDLLESGLKRSASVKDSGGIIPGRGGILDSVDSMIFTAPLYYYYVLLLAPR